VSKLQEKHRKDPALQLRKLREWLLDKESNLGNCLSLEGQSLEAIDPSRVLLLNSQRSIILQVLDVLQELESGSDDPNAEGDFLGADNLPPVHETGELLDL
jgi:hypothetical protein